MEKASPLDRIARTALVDRVCSKCRLLRRALLIWITSMPRRSPLMFIKPMGFMSTCMAAWAQCCTHQIGFHETLCMLRQTWHAYQPAHILVAPPVLVEAQCKESAKDTALVWMMQLCAKAQKSGIPQASQLQAGQLQAKAESEGDMAVKMSCKENSHQVPPESVSCKEFSGAWQQSQLRHSEISRK